MGSILCDYRTNLAINDGKWKEISFYRNCDAASVGGGGDSLVLSTELINDSELAIVKSYLS